jgi:long-chain fatty acid transport protein
MIEPSDRTRIGLRYLTETELDFKSDIYFSGVGPGIADLTKSVNGLDLGMKMPQSLMAGIFHQVNDAWALLGSVGWEDWSRFARIHVRVDGTEINRVVDAGFDDTWHFGVGTQYQYTPELMLTAGFSYDSSMSTGSTRPIMLPLGAMYRYGLGFKYRKNEDLLLGGGLSFFWEGDLKVKPGGGGADGQVSGQYDNVYITFLSLYVQWK